MDLEAHVGEVYRHGLGLAHEFLVNDEGIAVGLEHVVGIFWLVQSQCQPGASSASGGEVYPDGGLLLVREIRVKLLFGRLGKREHECLLNEWVEG